MTAFVNETITPEQAGALEVARALAAAGIPVFVAERDPAGKGSGDTGFWLPNGWQRTAADPAVVDRWRPGMALCAVMGHGLDLLDVDPRNGADLAALNGSTPTSYGTASTPSGGLHSFIASLGAGSRDKVAPGIDVKGGMPDGSSHGYAFLAPTVKASKVDGTQQPYRWITPPDLSALEKSRESGDSSGAALAARIRELRGSGSVTGRSTTSTAPEWYRAFLEQREPQSVAAATAAITEKLREVSEWTPASPAGFRQTLMRAAMTLGGYVGGGWLDEGDAWGRLELAVTAVWTNPDSDDRRWIEQGLTDGASSPFHVYTPEDEARYGEAAQAVAATRVGPSWSPQRALGAAAFDPAGCVHDQEYAEAVLALNAPVLRYGVDTGGWLKRRRFEVWSELPDQAGAAVADAARLMPPGRSPVPSNAAERSEEHWQAVRRALFLSSAGAGRVERKMRALVAGGDHPCTVDVADLDSSPEVLWAGGYPFDLRASGELPTLAAIHPDTPHLHTAAFAPQVVPTPRWDAFVAAVLPDEELRAWAMRVLAVCLTGYPDAVLPVLYGRERSGKTSLVTLIMSALGTYGHAADARLLGGSDAHASIVYDLKGRRLSFIDEGPRRGHLAAERLKQLTGGGRLTGNAMRSNPITFDPTHTLVMTTNDEPPITDPALRARVRLIPCDEPEAGVRAARQAITPAVWEAEAPGVLAALMAQSAAWLAAPDSAGIAVAPASVRALMGEMAAGQDPAREWVEMCTVPTKPGTPGRDLYRRFLLWHEGQPAYRRQAPPSETAFGRSLTEQGFGWVWENPKKERKLRPLSVMNPGGEAAPWTPSGPGAFPTGADSLRTVTDTWPTQLSAADNSRSDPVSSTSTDSTDSFSRSSNHNNTHTSIWSNTPAEIQDKAAANCPLSAPAEPNGASPAETTPGQSTSATVRSTPSDGVSAPGVSESTARKSNKIDTSDLSPAVVAAAETVDRTRERALAEGGDDEVVKKAVAATTNRAIAQLAEQTGRPKTELRKELTVARKELARRVAVALAGGAVHELPAAVDRAGHVLSVTLEQAVTIVRARVAAAGALTVDVEHTGYPIGHADYRLKTVQLGDDAACVVLDPVAHADAIRALVAEAPALHAHSATADLVPLAVAGLLGDDPAVGYEQAWSRMWDTTIPAKLADPASTGSDPGLKKLAAAVLGDLATAPGADVGRAALFTAGKWKTNPGTADPVERSGWAQVDPRCETMLRYAASDVLDTAALARAMPTPDARVAGRERLAQWMTARPAYRGVRLDPEQIATLTLAHRSGLAEATTAARRFGVENPGSDQQVAAKAVALGAALPQTPGGKPSVAAGVLDPLKDAPGELGEFVTAVLAHRHHETALGLFLDPYRDLVERGDGRARPTVYTLGTNTGRMCLPVEHQLVTPDGYVNPADVQPGMRTLDADGRWVRVLAVHSYADAPLQTLSNRGIEIAGTPEHRWVTTRDHEAAYARRRGRPVPPRELRRLGDDPRLRVHLAPDVAPFDLDARMIPANNEAECTAALVGMLVTDGRCVESDESGIGLRAYVYQTEAKFHAEFRRVIPEDAVMYDRVTTAGTAHHEIRIAARWLRPRLIAAGLRPGERLADSPDLHRWVAGLSLDAVRAFFAACWLADGTLAAGNIACRSANLRAALTLAAYRLGLVAYETELAPSEWSNGPRKVLVLRRPVITSRKSVHGETVGDVWCVTTETGTFTAVNPRGTVYLTGNSCVRPNLQQLSREGGIRACITADPGQVIVSADFSGVELRVAAALSGDPNLRQIIAAEDGFNAEVLARATAMGDPTEDGQKAARKAILAERGWPHAGVADGLHWIIARQIWGDTATKANRYIAKRIVFGRIYGGGVKNLSAQVGVSTDVGQQVLDTLDSITPTLKGWSREVSNAAGRGQTRFPAYSGRTIHLPGQTPHAAPNYAIQGSARELLVDALERWADTPWRDATLIPVHDELLAFVPAEDGQAATDALTRCMAGELHGVPIVSEADAPTFAWADSA